MQVAREGGWEDRGWLLMSILTCSPLARLVGALLETTCMPGGWTGGPFGKLSWALPLWCSRAAWS
jgi:hypothetical protein